MTRRIRRLVVTPPVWVALCSNTLRLGRSVRVVKNGLPEGTEYAGFCTFDPQRSAVNIFVTHPSFDEVEEHGIVPEHPTTEFTIAYE